MSTTERPNGSSSAPEPTEFELRRSELIADIGDVRNYSLSAGDRSTDANAFFRASKQYLGRSML